MRRQVSNRNPALFVLDSGKHTVLQEHRRLTESREDFELSAEEQRGGSQKREHIWGKTL